MNYFERLLEEKCKEEGRQDYQIQWGYDKKLYRSILSAVNESYPNYTDHGESHSNSILNNILKMFGDELKKLSSLDIWLLLEASYLHDCGMFISLKRVQEIIKENGFKDFIKTVQYNPKDPLFKYANQFILEDNEIKYSNSNYNPQKELAMKYLIAGYKRGSHAFELQETTTKRGDKLLPIRLYKILDLICESHCWDFEKLQRLPQKESGLINEIGHPRFISNLLRIGDLLDIDNNRMNYIQTRNLENEIPLDSKLHLDKHLAITHFRVDNERIEISALVDCESDTYEVADLTNLWFEYLEKEYSNQLHSWKEVIPTNFLGTLPTLGDLKVEIKNYEYIDSKNKPQFSINLEDVSELLMGDSIYRNKETAIRELIQNSIDATYIRVFEDKKNSNELNKLFEEMSQEEKSKFFEDKKIQITINKNFEKTTEEYNYWDISIKDKGIGIDKKKLKYILNTGSSFKDIKKHNLIEEMPFWLRPAGNFGIGFQSIFLLTDSVIINSKSLYTNEEIEVHLFKPSKKNRVYLKKTNFDYKKEIGTEIKFSYKTSKINYFYSFKNELLIKFLENFDELVDSEFDSEILSILNTINETNKYSLIDIKVKKESGSESFNLDSKELMKDKFDSNSKFEIRLKPIHKLLNNLVMEDSIYFRNQLISNRESVGLDILSFDINLIGFKAKEILEINRNHMKMNFYTDYIEQLRKDIFGYVYKTYLQTSVLNINIAILLFYIYYKKKFDELGLVFEDEKAKEIKNKVFDHTFDFGYSLNHFISKENLKISIKNEVDESYEVSWDEETTTTLSNTELDIIFDLILEENYYELEYNNQSIEFQKKQHNSEEKINIPYKLQIEKRNKTKEFIFTKFGRVFLYYNGEFPKLRLKKERNRALKLVESIDYEEIGYRFKLYKILNRNLILCPIFIKEEYGVYNSEIKEKYINYCLENNFNKNVTKEEIEEELKKFVDVLKKELTIEIRGLIKYLCKPSSWGNIKLSNLEVFL